MPRTNETRHIKWHETCKCKCRLEINNVGIMINADVNAKNLLIMEGVINKMLFNWNPSNYEYECDNLCDVGEYLDYNNCKCRKKLNDKLVEECSENIDENKMIYNSSLNDYEKNMLFLHIIHSIISHIFHNTYKH